MVCLLYSGYLVITHSKSHDLQSEVKSAVRALALEVCVAKPYLFLIQI